MAFTLNGDAGSETGAGVQCYGGRIGDPRGPKQSFLGWMAYNRIWWHHDLFAWTLGGGYINNPGRYLVLTPPVDGATAGTGTPYFTQNPGDRSRPGTRPRPGITCPGISLPFALSSGTTLAG